MPKIDVYNIEGKKVNDVELKEDIFGIIPNEELVHSVIVNYLANQRQGTQSTKTRAEVRGGGKKPWRQKGTGRARQGSIRAPHWVGGGTKEVAKMLNNLKLKGKTLILLPEKNEIIQKSARNIKGVKTLSVNTINAYDLVNYKNLVVTLDTVKRLEEVYA